MNEHKTLPCSFDDVNRIILWVLLLFALLPVYIPVMAQSSPAYTIHSQESHSIHTDTPDINTLIKTAYSLTYQYPDSAIVKYHAAMDLCRRLNCPEGKVCILMGLGVAYDEKGMGQEALWYNALMKVQLDQLPDTLRLRYSGRYYNNMAKIYLERNQYDTALLYLTLGLKTSEVAGDYSNMIKIHANISRLWLVKNQSGKALHHLYKGLALAERYPAAPSIPQLYHNLIDLKNENKNDDSTLILAHKMLASSEITHDSYHKIWAMGILGGEFAKRRQFDSAEYYLKDAEQYALQKNYNPQKFGIFYKLGMYYQEKIQYSVALPYMKQALDYEEQSNQRGTRLTQVWLGMATILNAMGRYAEAIDYLGPYAILKDSLMAIGNNKALYELEARYSSAEKDRLITESTLKLERQERNIVRKNFLLGVIIAGIVLITVLSIIFYRSLKQKQLNRIRFLEAENKISHLHAIIEGEEKERKRIARELHDGIGGMLAAVKMNFSAIQQRYESVYGPGELSTLIHMLEDTSDEVRKTAHNLMPGMLVTHSLTDALQQWCSHINAGGQLTINLRISGIDQPLAKDFELMLFRMVQELVHNIIKHAHAHSVEIHIRHEEEKIHIFVEDDGCGFDPDMQEKGGFGLQNLRYRVQALDGQIIIDTEPGRGTAISIILDDNNVKMAFST